MSRKDLLPDAGPVLSLRAALYRACRDHKSGITGVAHQIGVEPDALQKRLNPNDTRLIPLEWIEDIVLVTRDERLLSALVRPAGAMVFSPVPVEASRPALQALGGLLEDEGKFVGSLHEGAADGVWLAHEVEDLEYHANRVIAAILGIVAGARQAMEGDQ